MADEALTTGAPAAAEPTLRDTIASNLAEVTKADDNAGAAAPEAAPTAPAAIETGNPAAAASTAPADGRARNADGTFAPAPKESATQAAPASSSGPSPAVAPAVADPAAARMPTSWKREMQAEWEKLPASVQQEFVRRESAFSQGIQQYKALADRAKPLDEAVAPYREILKQHGMDEAKSVKQLLDVQYALTMGQPQQKQDIINGLIADYKLPVRLAVQNAAGEWQLVEAAAPRSAPQQQAPAQQQDPRAIVREELQAHEVGRQLREFVESKDASGSPLYPHYEAVKDDMAVLLESGRAEDLKGAYDKAIRLHDDIWQAHQQATAAADAKKAAEAKKAAVARARSSAVSVVSSTPSGNMVTNGDKSLSEQLRDNLREVAGGRV